MLKCEGAKGLSEIRPRFCRPYRFLHCWIALVFAAVLSSGCSDSIHDAALKGDLKSARRLLDANPQLINSRNKLGKTPLHQSLTGGNDEIIKLLIERGADVKARDNTGLTPLHIAAWWSVTARAKILIDHGADVTATDKFGDTPLHTASMHGRGKMCLFLIENGARIDTKNLDGRTARDLATQQGQEEPIRVFTHFDKIETIKKRLENIGHSGASM